jgi:NinB protein
MITRVITGEVSRKAICRHVLTAPEGNVVTIKEPTRNLEQNAKMWAMLADIENQTDWHGIKLNAEEWKDLLSAGLVQSKVVPNLEGNGFVILGQRTSKMTKSQFAALIELIYSFGAEKNVIWTEPEAQGPERFAA